MIRKIFRDYQKTLYNKMENLHRHQINNINNNENEKTNNSQKRKRESNYENEKNIKLAYEHNYEMQLKNKKSNIVYCDISNESGKKINNNIVSQFENYNRENNSKDIIVKKMPKNINKNIFDEEIIHNSDYIKSIDK